MTLTDLGSLGEFVGSIAVLVTLILLLLQLRENTSTLQSTAASDLSRQIASWHGRAASNTDILRVWDLGVSDSLIEPVDIARFKWFVAEYILLCESAYFRHQRGQLIDETWESYLSAVLGFLDIDVISDAWEKNEVAMSHSYKEHVNEARLTGRARHTMPVPGRLVNTEQNRG